MGDEMTAALQRAQKTAVAAQRMAPAQAQAALSDSAQPLFVALERELHELRGQIDSLSEMGETESLRLQMAMDRMSKMMSTLSNMLKKISDTSSQITQNLK